MAEESHKLDLELTEDLEFERREWRVQRVAWAVMALVVAAGLLGVFGGAGYVSSRTISTADGALKIIYNRFERYQAPSTLRVELRPSDQPAARLWISGQYLKTVKVEAIVPPPEGIDVQAGGSVFVFAVPRNEPFVVVFYLQTDQRGSSPIRMRLNEGPILEASHWVYP
jgi:hypothetical protein